MKAKKFLIYMFNCLGIFLTLPFLSILALLYFKRLDFFIISILTFLYLIIYFLNMYIKQELKNKSNS